MPESGKKKPVGRTDRLDLDEIIIDIENAVANGAQNNRQIADAIGVNYRTFHNWVYRKDTESQRKRREKVNNAIKRGLNRQRKNFRKVAENALLKSITGFYVEEEITEIKKVGDTETIQKKKIRKFVNPNVTAQIFALVNNSERWKSVNKVIVEKDDSKSAFQVWLEKQEKLHAPKKMGQPPIPKHKRKPPKK